jgi:hypothetical protein
MTAMFWLFACTEATDYAFSLLSKALSRQFIFSWVTFVVDFFLYACIWQQTNFSFSFVFFSLTKGEYCTEKKSATKGE